VPDGRPVLVMISEDPRLSHRANEAMRIALGVVAGENEVAVVLSGPAAHLLDADTDDLVDGDDIAKFRANLSALGVPFHVEEDSRPPEPDWNAAGHPVTVLDRAGIADFMRRSRRTLIF
jgi:hypothetical protein